MRSCASLPTLVITLALFQAVGLGGERLAAADRALAVTAGPAPAPGGGLKLRVIAPAKPVAGAARLVREGPNGEPLG